MTANILNFIRRAITYAGVELKSYYAGKNRINNVGIALEEYIKDLFADTLGEHDPEKRLATFSEVFSYLGNQNNPPDIIIRGGDAVEIKKIENVYSSLALNSSYPKARLFADDSLITKSCRNCEKWQEKDILYVIGTVIEEHLKSLFIIYGVDYAASNQIYERVKAAVSSGVKNIPQVEFAPTKELGRVNMVDPLGITYLRIRGMWGIEHPLKVFSYLNLPVNNGFSLYAVINSEKYNSFPEADRENLEKLSNSQFKINTVKIKNPDNPAVLQAAKLIIFTKPEI